jgi:asparagine synthase (glutamine-hydrolysing)
MLSGGVDSSLIVAIAKSQAVTVNTFTCGTTGSSDLVSAREVADLLGTDHHEVIVEVDRLPEIVTRVVRETCSFEPWTVMAGIGTFLTSEFAKHEGFKVLLAGEGADELFCGYDEFRHVPYPLLEAQLVQYQYDLGVTECLRLDRATMANGVEARVPFLSSSLIRYARALDTTRKIERNGPIVRRKSDLRNHAKKVLPPHIADREKVEFKDGSGLSNSLWKLAEDFCSKKQLFEVNAAFPSFCVNSSLAGWFLLSWFNEFGCTIGTDLSQMRSRGLFRQSVSEYMAPGLDPVKYE